MKLSQSIISSVLLCAIFFSILRNPALYLNFELNQQKIYENFCRNFDKPISSCGGKCHLLDQMNHTHDEAESSKNHKLDLKETLLYWIKASSFKLVQNVLRAFFIKVSIEYSFLDASSLFRPPID